MPNDARGNRRLVSRFPCRLSVRYECGGKWHPATTVDLSSLGCRLRLGERLQRGERIRVVIEYLESEPIVRAEARGEVIWSRLEGLSYQAGIRFLDEMTEIQSLLG
jgi:hypothetical protein